MSKNTSISLSQHFEGFIEKELKSGRYNSTSEVVRAALRLLEREEEKLSILRKEIELGIASGFDESFDPKSHLLSLNDRNKKSEEL